MSAADYCLGVKLLLPVLLVGLLKARRVAAPALTLVLASVRQLRTREGQPSRSMLIDLGTNLVAGTAVTLVQSDQVLLVRLQVEADQHRILTITMTTLDRNVKEVVPVEAGTINVMLVVVLVVLLLPPTHKCKSKPLQIEVVKRLTTSTTAERITRLSAKSSVGYIST